MLPLESFAWLRLCLDSEKQTVLLEDAMNRCPMKRNVELVLDSPCAPGRVFALDVDYPVYQSLLGLVMRFPWSCLCRFQAINPIVLEAPAPPSQAALRKAVELAKLGCCLGSLRVKHNCLEPYVHSFHHVSHRKAVG